MEKIEMHLDLCDNEATDLQYEILAKQLPSMNQRINDAYKNTREFVNFIHEYFTSCKNQFCFRRIGRTRIYTFCVFIRSSYKRKY